MTSPWAAGEQPSTDPVSAETVTVVDGSTFCLSSATGEILPSRAHGLFVRDTRVLSHWDLRVDGVVPERLTVEITEPFAATFIGRVTGQAGPSESSLLVVRRRYVGDGMREDITIRNLSAQAVAVDVVMTVGADFADLFEVKDGRFRDGGQAPRWPPRCCSAVTGSDTRLRCSSRPTPPPRPAPTRRWPRSNHIALTINDSACSVRAATMWQRSTTPGRVWSTPRRSGRIRTAPRTSSTPLIMAAGVAGSSRISSTRVLMPRTPCPPGATAEHAPSPAKRWCTRSTPSGAPCAWAERD